MREAFTCLQWRKRAHRNRLWRLRLRNAESSGQPHCPRFARCNRSFPRRAIFRRTLIIKIARLTFPAKALSRKYGCANAKASFCLRELFINNFSISRKSKNHTFYSCTQFADTSAHGKGECPRLYNMCAPIYREHRGKPFGFPLKSQKFVLSA